MSILRHGTYPLRIPISEYPNFSDRLKVAMRLRKCSVEELAKMTYLSKAAICGYRKGTRTPNVVILRLIAKALNVKQPVTSPTFTLLKTYKIFKMYRFNIEKRCTY